MGQPPDLIMIHGQMPRSGINFVMDVLSKHGETYRQPNQIYEFHHLAMSEHLDKYIRRLKLSAHMKGIDEHKLKQHIGAAWIGYLNEYCEWPRRSILLKESNVDKLGQFFEYFPSARLIIMVRDGRNAVSSLLKSGMASKGEIVRSSSSFKAFLSATARHDARTLLKESWKRIRYSGFELACMRWNQSALKVADLVHDVFADRKEQVVLLRYEDVFQDRASAAKRLLDFCNLPHDRYDWTALAEMPVRGSSFLRDADGQVNFSRGFSPDTQFQPLKRWADWAESEHATFWRLCRSGMRALQYDDDPFVAQVPSPERSLSAKRSNGVSSA